MVIANKRTSTFNNMKYTVKRYSFSFGVIATIVTGHTFAKPVELQRFAKLIARDTVGQVMADRKSKWAPWLIVQIPSLAKIPQSFGGIEEAVDWFKKANKRHGPDKDVIRAVEIEY